MCHYTPLQCSNKANLLWNAEAEIEHEIIVCYDFDEDTTLPILKNVEQILQQNKTKAEKTLENFN